ncbi:MAG: exodeoxyribonuclease V subunit gamma [Deltaproteobacteria bacterium]|nr:exodeoxyribonuclease V subunit gamma [Deltaproteobacteria bacterium]
MLRIHASHRTEVLLDAFVRNLLAEREQAGPFAPVRVVVPNPNIETYLRLGVAEHLGIAANVETTFLRKFLAGLAEDAVPDGRVADASLVEGHLLALLHDDDFLARPELGRVRGYLHAAGSDPDAVDRRRCQLAARLAHLFDEYAGSRPAMLQAWCAGQPHGVHADQAWQQRLWLAVFGEGGRLARQGQLDGTRWLTLEALWDEAMRRSPAPFSGQTLHVFGLSYMAAAYHRMLADLARASDIRLYTLNPCRESLGEPAAAGEIPAFADDEHAALALWARPGRENLHLLARQPGAQVEQLFAAGEATTLLRRLQSDIANRQAPAGPAARLDGSLRILPCPSLRRELEVVAAEIWALLRKDPSLAARDIAVIVPEADKDLYLAQLPAVFRVSCDLPFHATDLPAAGSHPVADAISRLLDLPFAGLTRKALLPLLAHPCLMARFPGATPAAWHGLADALGIVRGADRGDFSPSYLGRDLYSWDQGLRRLALGAVMDAGPEAAAAPLALGGELYLPGPLVDGNDDDAYLGFGLLSRSLLADAAAAAGRGGPRERPLSEWLEFVRGLLRAYLVLDADDGPGQAVVMRFLAALDAVDSPGLGETQVSYRVAAELARRALASLPASRGHYLARGVTCASFLPMRAIPFRAIFVLGLGQGAFPRPAGRDELDLRGEERRPGDVDRREQDLYMFLETLLSARDHLVLSYVSRDEITGDELPASPLLLELRGLLGQGYLDRAALARLYCDEPAARPALRRYDDSDERRAVLPAAEAERAAKLHRGQETARAPSPGPAAASHAAAPVTLDIPLWALRLFLLDPLEGSARLKLGLRSDEDEDAASVEDEPFDTERWLLAQLVRDSMTGAVLAAQGVPAWEALERAHEQQALLAELSGKSPSGMYREAGARQEKAILRAWHRKLPELLGDRGARCRRFHLVPSLGPGAADEAMDERDRVCLLAPAFSIALPALGPRPASHVLVRVVGQTELWAQSPGFCDAALAFTCRSGVRPKNLEKEDLRAFLDHVALAAAGRASSRPAVTSALFHAAGDKADMRAWPLASLSRETALRYLRDLCAELVAGAPDGLGAPSLVHPYLLPFAAVLRSRTGGGSLRAEIEKAAGKAETERNGTLREVASRYAPPPAAEAERMAEVRFGLFFRLTRQEAT